MKTRLIPLLLILAMLVTLLAPFPVSAAPEIWDGSTAKGFESGKGTKTNPYIIKTASQLRYFATQVSNRNSFKDKYVCLDADIVLNDTTGWENWLLNPPKNKWTPIGGNDHFCGNFDGRDHTITGIYINDYGNAKGLFSSLYGATVKNVSIEKSVIQGQSNIGGIAGSCSSNGIYKSTISNCHNGGIVSGGGSNVGGIVGYCSSLGSTSLVENCSNTGNIRGNAECTGGIVGQNRAAVQQGDTVTVAYATVTDCCNTGNIISSKENVGGIVGSNVAEVRGNALVANCYNTGSVTGDTHVGGIAGFLSVGFGFLSELINCYNTGEIYGQHAVGGIIGWYGTPGYFLEQWKEMKIDCVSIHAENCYYLAGCAVDRMAAVQNGVGAGSWGHAASDPKKIERERFSQSITTTALTENQMKQKASFAGFDFSKIWTIGKGTPTLRWQKTPVDPSFGDINGDTVVNAMDCLILKGYILKTLKNATDEQIARMDLNGAGGINAMDYAILRSIVLGKFNG